MAEKIGKPKYSDLQFQAIEDAIHTFLAGKRKDRVALPGISFRNGSPVSSEDCFTLREELMSNSKGFAEKVEVKGNVERSIYPLVIKDFKVAMITTTYEDGSDTEYILFKGKF